MVKRIFESVRARLKSNVVMYYVEPATGQKRYGFQEQLPAAPFPSHTFWTDDRELADTFTSPEAAIATLANFPPLVAAPAPLRFEPV